MTLLDLARCWRHVRETTQNQGQRVNAIQMFSGGTDALGTSWCAWWATLILDLWYGGLSPVPRMGNVQEIRALCSARGWMTTAPVPGDLFFYVDANDHAHHMGFYTAPGPTGIAGNTDATGTSSNGDRVAEHPLATAGTILYAHLPEAT